MIFPDLIKFSFIIVCFVLCIFLTVLTVIMYRMKNDYRNYIAAPVIVGIFTIIAYCLFLCAGENGKLYAILFDSFFFIGTDWLAMFMCIFSIAYTGIGKKYIKLFLKIGVTLCVLDSVSLLLNNVFFHSFDLVYKTTENLVEMGFWANAFTKLHYLHLAMDYVMVGITIVFFAIASLTAPDFYKRKYNGILYVYIVVIIANFISYTINLPIDSSVVLYAVLAGFISYYSTFSFPQNLLNQSLGMVHNTISDGILYFDDQGRCIYANQKAKTLFSFPGKGFSEVAAEKYRNKIVDMKNRGLDKNGKITDSIKIEDKVYYFEIEIQYEYEENLEIGCCIKLVDKTKETDIYLSERYKATHDELTGLYNRSGFYEAVTDLMKNETTENRVMVVSNIKDFKLINELFGESVGDEVLIRQAEMLKEKSHESSIFGRLTDDKFALYVEKENFNESFFLECIERLQKLAESTTYRMHIYVGIYEVRGRIETAQIMCDKAYLAISSISGGYDKIFSYYDSNLMEKILIEKNIIDEFDNAISTGQIKMYLQPIVDAKNVKYGAEALCRWQHPLEGLLKPADFLSVLEKNGLIFQLDEYIWECAAKKLHEWSEKGCKDCYISVNVSVKDFYFTDIYKTFTRLADDYDIDPSMLHIDITESVLMSDFTKAFQLCNKLQKSGFQVAIDNFGNGYSSLNMLKDFKARALKIDMELLRNIESYERNQIILEAIINLAKMLHMEVIGEGVENKEQYDVLRQYGCECFQGNCIFEPMTVSEYEDLFIKYSQK